MSSVAVGRCPSCGNYRSKHDACDTCGWQNVMFDISQEERIRRRFDYNLQHHSFIVPDRKYRKGPYPVGYTI